MIWDIQRASLWKRASAALFDIILVVVIAIGIGWLISAITNYDQKVDTFDSCISEYSERYDTDLRMTQDDYSKLSEEDQQKYNAASAAIIQDEVYLKTKALLLNLTLLMISLSLFVSIAIWKFIIPLFLKNGQTIGKKCFNICIVKNNSVRINKMQLFTRSILGEYVIETMVPILTILMMVFGLIGKIGLILLGIFAIVQLVLLFATGNKTPIHDILAYTVVVDKPSQMIYDSEEELMKYKKDYALKQSQNQHNY